MKKTIALSILVLSMGTTFAANNIFETNNPFPQTMPQSMNNLYEAEPANIMHEAKQEKKSWFRKGKNLRDQEVQEAKQKGINTYPNEGANNGSFYMFK